MASLTIPKTPDVIYHYCTIDSFFQIIETGHIRASLHTSLNDFTDSSWWYHLLRDICNSRVTDDNRTVLGTFLDTVRINIGQYFISSFSTEPDILSQWRAYTEDGNGFAIGFFTDNFYAKRQIPHYNASGQEHRGIFAINYDRSEQVAAAEEIIDAVLKNGVESAIVSMNFQPFLLASKNPAFIEEKEVRYVEILNLDTGMNPDVFGLRTLNPCKHLEFRASGSRDIVSYRKLNLFKKQDNENLKSIHSVYFGPKNTMPGTHLSMFLRKHEIKVEHGFHKSSATYR